MATCQAMRASARPTNERTPYPHILSYSHQSHQFPCTTHSHFLLSNKKKETHTYLGKHWSDQNHKKQWQPHYKQLQLLCNQPRLVFKEEALTSWGLLWVSAKPSASNRALPGSLAPCRLISRTWLRGALMLPKLLALLLPLLPLLSQYVLTFTFAITSS